MKARDLAFSPCPLAEVREFVEIHHYSHNLNGVKITQCFRADYQDALVGAAVFGALSTTAWKKFAAQESAVLELRRLVLLDCAERNSESRMIGTTLRWLRKYRPAVEIVVAYADPLYNHLGTIYRASNFFYMGLSGKDKGFRDPETGRVYHSRALRTTYKGTYKPFVQRLREKKAAGLLEIIDLPGKHCYVYRLRDGQ